MIMHIWRDPFDLCIEKTSWDIDALQLLPALFTSQDQSQE
jgi:hypothetical protein